MRVFQ